MSWLELYSNEIFHEKTERELAVMMMNMILLSIKKKL